ncbi:hypothetical protein Tsubulata_045150 [Turnera subulata]|uniref:Endonuclease/exonuclease/phosphatase domain-containing protein n=1 Tax=Turnera subulata TaxID=218843 RepID=A0A9Q0FRZ3_9ROSI|nr:hypothetical protein Tsubulata_045150 [Turnera subulata]
MHGLFVFFTGLTCTVRHGETTSRRGGASGDRHGEETKTATGAKEEANSGRRVWKGRRLQGSAVSINSESSTKKKKSDGERGQFARVAVDVDLLSPLKGKVELDGELLRVSYEGLPQVCYVCGCVGHPTIACPRRAPSASVGASEGAPVQLSGSSGVASHGRPVPAKVVSPPTDGEGAGECGEWMVVSRKVTRGKRKDLPPQNQASHVQIGQGSRFSVLMEEDSSGQPTSIMETPSMRIPPHSGLNLNIGKGKGPAIDSPTGSSKLGPKSTNTSSGPVKVGPGPRVHTAQSTHNTDPIKTTSSVPSVPIPAATSVSHSVGVTATEPSPAHSRHTAVSFPLTSHSHIVSVDHSSSPPVSPSELGVIPPSAEAGVGTDLLSISEPVGSSHARPPDLNVKIRDPKVKLKTGEVPSSPPSSGFVLKKKASGKVQGSIRVPSTDESSITARAIKDVSASMGGVGGAGSAHFLATVKEYIRCNKPNVLILLEPRISGLTADRVVRRLGFSNSHRVEDVGFSGGVWVLWHGQEVRVSVLADHLHFTHIRLVTSSFCILVTAVYGCPRAAPRRFLWSNLVSLASSIREPWLVCGDFNAILHTSEARRMGLSMLLGCRNFRNCVEECELSDLGFHGP